MKPALLVTQRVELNTVVAYKHQTSAIFHVTFVRVFTSRGRTDQRDGAEDTVYPFENLIRLRMRGEQQRKSRRIAF